MIDDRLTLERLFDQGWTINQKTGVELPRFASVSLCLMRDGHRSICIPGYGETKDDAMADAVVEVNTWIERQAAEAAQEAELQDLFVPKGRRLRWTDPRQMEEL